MDREETFIMDKPHDLFVLSPGVTMKWENISKNKPWIYIIVAVPAGIKYMFHNPKG